jgi:hypothetical protein
MEVTDKPGLDNFIEDFIPSPKDLQKVHFRVSKVIPKWYNSTKFSLVERVILYSLTRQGLQNTKFITLYCLASNLRKQGVTRLSLDKRNRLLGAYIQKVYSTVIIDYRSTKGEFWKNGLTLQSFESKLRWSVMSIFSFCYVVLMIILSKPFKTKSLPVEWMSFANNRENIDYQVIEELNRRKVYTKHLSLFPANRKVESLIFRYKKYSIKAWVEFFLGIHIRLGYHQKRVYGLINEECDLILPLNYSLSIREKMLYIQQFLYSEYENNMDGLVLFRGGNAAGIWKECLMSKRMTFLLPHGTEFSPIDHVIYRHIDLNLLPSQGIVENWLSIDEKIRSKCIRALGRPYYEVLKRNVSRKQEQAIVGIVLTYSSDIRTKNFILDIVESFSFQGLKFLVKERPNYSNDLSFLSDLDVVSVHEGDIYSFLSEATFVVAGISDYGVLGMTVTDAISVGIPGFYFTQSQNPKECGYSYHKSMEKYTYTEKIEMKLFIESFRDFQHLVTTVTSINADTKSLLGSNEGVIENTIRLLAKFSRN